MSADARIVALLGIAAADVGAAEKLGATLPGHAAFHLQQAKRFVHGDLQVGYRLTQAGHAAAVQEIRRLQMAG